MILSRRFKEAVKTALAITIAIGIALSMDWDKPEWAGFTVAFISLATVGQSLNQGAMRLLGTLLGALAALSIIALFAQERWLYMLALSVFAAFCIYMKGGTRHQYFWQISGVACVIIAVEAGFDPVNAFETAVQRTEETSLGVLVYSLVSVLLWPSSTGSEFTAVVAKLVSTQQKLFEASMRGMVGQGGAEESDPLRAQAIQQHARFSQLLEGAVTESYEIWEQRHQWRAYRTQVAEFAQALEGWRDSFSELRGLDLGLLLPNLVDFDTELQGRLTEIAGMHQGQAPTRQPQVVDLTVDTAAIRDLSHFHQAALTVTRSRLQQLEQVTRAIFDSVSEIRGFGRGSAKVLRPTSRTGFSLPDPDRIAPAIRVLATLWLAYLAYIYVPDIPGGTGFVIFSGSVGMALATVPQAGVSLLFVPAAASVLFAGGLYIFVMPQLSSYTSLGLLIFALTFAICYLFAAPRQVVGRALGLAMFFAIAGITNEQSYSFLAVADTALMFPLVLFVVAVTAYIPISTRPRVVFLRLLARFFRSAEHLLSTLRWDPDHRPGRMDALRKAFYTRELTTLPHKLESWVGALDTDTLGGTTPQQVQGLVTSLQALSYRMQGLLEARSHHQADFLVQELLADIRDWRVLAQDACKRLSEDPASGTREGFRAKLDDVLKHLEERIEDTFDQAGSEQLSAQDGEHFYRLLGAYRGVSEAMVAYAGSTDTINWDRWRESRF